MRTASTPRWAWPERAVASASRAAASLASYPARVRAAAGWAIVATLLFGSPLAALAGHAWSTDLHSHIVLVPFIAAYLLALRRPELAIRYVPANRLALALALLAVGFTALAVTLSGRAPLSPNDHLALLATAYVSLLVAGAALCLGSAWLRSAAFPLAFLAFLIPLPDGVLAALERGAQAGSAEVAHVLFWLSGLPFQRDGMAFALSNITVVVGPECSGIRSSWVLFITALLAGALFLRRPRHRLWLAAAVIPIGLLRNGLRIMIIGDLCVEIGPHMIDHAIHRQGGPIFFLLSLVPLAALACWLRGLERRETNRARPFAQAVAFLRK